MRAFIRSLLLPGLALNIILFVTTSKTSSNYTQQARLVPPELVTQTGHSSKVTAVALTADKRVLASASADNTIRLWDIATGNELRALTGHNNWVKCVTFSSNGKLLVSGSNDRTVRIWDVENGKELKALSGHTGPIESIAISPDDRWIASGSADNTIKLWDSASGNEISTLRNHSGWVTNVAFSQNGNLLATASRDNTIRLWNTTSKQELQILKGHTDRIASIVFSRDQQLLASSSFDHTIKLWKTTNGKQQKSFRTSGNIIATNFSANGHQLFGAANNKSLELFDLDTGKSSPISDAASDQLVEAIAFSADGQIYASTADKTVELNDAISGRTIRTFSSRAAGLYAVAFSADRHWLAFAGKDRTVRLWDTATGRELPALVGHTGYVTSLSFSNDSRILASASLDRTIRLWDTTTGLELEKFVGHEDSIDSLSFSPDNKWLASAGLDNTVRIWNLAEHKEFKRLTGNSGEITTVTFSSDGKLLASGSVDKSIRIWDTSNWTDPRVLQFGSIVTSLAFAPDNKTLAIAGETELKLVEIASGKELHSVKINSSVVRGLAFSTDSRSLVSGSSDGSIKVWNATTMDEPKVLRGHSGGVNSIAVSNDNKWIFSAGEDGTIIIWEGERKAATLMSFRDSSDWLVLTPDGLFDGAPGSWNQILWRFSGNTFNVSPAESFFSEFYYPSLLADLLAGKQPRAPQDISLKDRRQPRLQISSPSPTSTADTAKSVSIKIEVAEVKPDSTHQTGSGVRDVRLFRNGSLVKVWHGSVKLDSQGQASLETNVPLVAGPNKLTVYAFNQDNIKSSDVLLTIQGDEKLRRKGIAYIVAVGVNQYANPEFNLRYAVPDAQDFGKELEQAQQSLNNFDHIQLIPLFDSNATKANILSVLRFLAVGGANGVSDKVFEQIKPAQPEDVVVVYFAGHGTAPDDGHFYLIPHDLGYDGPRTNFSPENLQKILQHSISDQELEDSLEKIDAGHFLLVIDACNSGQALEAEEKRRGPMNSRGLAQLAYEKGMHILTAAQSYQAALEKRSLSHGYLTYALVEEGLKTRAADNSPKDGQVTLQEWLDYAVGRVPLMQTGLAKDEQGRLLEHEEEKKKKKTINDVQRPRVFYRLGFDSNPLIVAKPGSNQAAQD